MSKMRVYEYAKKQNVPSKDVIHKLKEMNIEVNNHMAMLEADVVEKLDHQYRPNTGKKEEKKAEKKTEKPKRPTPAKAADFADEEMFDDSKEAAKMKTGEEKGSAKREGNEKNRGATARKETAPNGEKERKSADEREKAGSTSRQTSAAAGEKRKRAAEKNYV
ncbi:Translation initiation factor IF-2 [Geobacillus sp. BCO2]|nr:Translation initiation factor IF-2 [Geobacillus sp. BCO2]